MNLTIHQHDSVTVWVLPTGPLRENAVLVADPSGQGFLIDPGDDAQALLGLIEQLGVQVQAILLTHGHFDHIGAVQPLREALKVPVALHARELELYQMGEVAAARWNLPFVQPAPPEQRLYQDQLWQAGRLKLRVRELPGHSPGHVVFVGDGFAVVGDTLFAESIGRTDLPGGDHAQLLAGIRQELLTLPEETGLYPGHGPSTTVAHERRVNPFVRDTAQL